MFWKMHVFKISESGLPEWSEVVAETDVQEQKVINASLCSVAYRLALLRQRKLFACMLVHSKCLPPWDDAGRSLQDTGCWLLDVLSNQFLKLTSKRHDKFGKKSKYVLLDRWIACTGALPGCSNQPGGALWGAIPVVRALS